MGGCKDAMDRSGRKKAQHPTSLKRYRRAESLDKYLEDLVYIMPSCTCEVDFDLYVFAKYFNTLIHDDLITCIQYVCSYEIF